MPEQPLVSICIPSYNHARFLPTAIESTLSQTYRNIEIIIVDDGSPDGSLEIAESYAARYPERIRVFTHPGHQNRGISATVNLGFEKSRGTYWSGLPSDDVLYPDKIERQVEFLERDRGTGFVYSHADRIDEQGERLPEVPSIDISGDPDPLARLIQGNAIPGVTVLARRECVEKVGPHDEMLVYSDWDFWVRMLAHYDVGFLDRSLVMYRIHSYNTSVGITWETGLQYGLAVMIALREKIPVVGGALARPRIRALIDLQLAGMFFCLEDIVNSARNLTSALTTDPSLATDEESYLNLVAQRFLYKPTGLLRPANYLSQLFILLPNKYIGVRVLKRRLWGQYHGIRLFEGYRDHQLGVVRQHLLRAIYYDSSLLRNLGVWSIGMEALFGQRVARWIRQSARKALRKLPS